MSYFAAYCPEDDNADIAFGDHVATNSGWVAFLDWAESVRGDCPALAALSDDGCAPPVPLEEELKRVIKEKPNEPTAEVLSVAGQLLNVVRARPHGTVSVAVTDGTGGTGDDEEE